MEINRIIEKINLKKLKKNLFSKNNFTIRKEVLTISIIIIFVSIIGFSTFKYFELESLIKNSEKLTQKEEYGDAIEKLMLAKIDWFTENFGFKRNEINDKINQNQNSLMDYLIYRDGLYNIDAGNYSIAIELLSDINEASRYYNDAKMSIMRAENSLLEEDVIKEKRAKEKAELKARQEATKREIEEEKRRAKEEELAEKEAIEERMSADKDNDGLTYREEQKLGSSDLDKDSDNDGINDGDDLHPNGGGRYQAQSFTWSYGGYEWKWETQIHEDWYEYYKAKERVEHGIDYITADDPFIKSAASIIKEKANQNNLSKSEMALSFVQSLPYIRDIYTGYDEYPKYPVETFFEKNGDCEDSSYLAAAIINAMGVGDAIIMIPGSPGHMGIGIWMDCDSEGSYYRADGRCYYFGETTAEGYNIGDLSSEYQNKKAQLIEVSSGNEFNLYPQYNAPCEPLPNFPGYYYSDGDYYSNNKCTEWVYCLPLPYKDFYYNPVEKNLYWDNNCNQLMIKGCYKSEYYPGFFYNDNYSYYYDSRCTRPADL